MSDNHKSLLLSAMPGALARTGKCLVRLYGALVLRTMNGTLSRMRKLTSEEYRATMGEPHVAVGRDDEPPFDFWDYFEGIPAQDFGGFDFSAGTVTNAWTTRDGEFQHALIACETPNVFFVLVLDLAAGHVWGHHLLHLNDLYGT